MTSTPWRRSASQTTSAPIRVRLRGLHLVEHRLARLLDGGGVRRCRRPARGCAARARPGRRPRLRPGAGLRRVRRPLRHRHPVSPSPWSCRDHGAVRVRAYEKTPAASGEGPFGSRWLLALADPPRSSVLPPGAGNEPRRPSSPRGASEEARGAIRRRSRHRRAGRATRRPSVVTTTAIAATILTVEQAQFGLRERPAGRSSPAVCGQSTSLRQFRNHRHRTEPHRGRTRDGLADACEALPVLDGGTLHGPLQRHGAQSAILALSPTRAAVRRPVP